MLRKTLLLVILNGVADATLAVVALLFAGNSQKVMNTGGQEQTCYSATFVSYAVQNESFRADQSDVSRASSSRFGFSSLLFVILMSTASLARAGEFCSAAPFFGTIDGTNPVHLADLGTQITIDGDCTFQNFIAPNTLDVTINFQTTDDSVYLIIFDNVDFGGNMACANIDHKIWFSNSSTNSINNIKKNCQDLFIPVEEIDKQNPAGQTTATIGVPFTYKLILPSLLGFNDPSLDTLHSVVLWDDLTATGADLTYVGINAYYLGSGAPVTLVPETDPTSQGGVWTPKNLSYKPIPQIDKGEQIVVEITVVLDDTPANVAGTQFINTAKWWFGRLIELDGVLTPFDPLPGDWGITPPMTIVEPDLVIRKGGSESVLNNGVTATFTIDVQNVGGGDAWNISLLDQLPDGPTAGMCDYDPTTGAGVTVEIVEAGGAPITGLLIPTVDFSVAYIGAPTCQLSMTMLTPASVLKPSQRMIIKYQSQLDADTTGNGIQLTNVAGATQWFSGEASSNPRQYDRVLTNGTPFTSDHEDSFVVTTSLSGYVFHKTVSNLTTGVDPTLSAAPGDTLHYKLRLFNVNQNFTAITIVDPLDGNYFDLASFNPATVVLPANAQYSYTPGGLLTINGLGGADLNLNQGDELVVEFDITLDGAPPLNNGDNVFNQASLTSNAINALSDDPAFGIVAPGDPGEPTLVVIQTPGPLSKVNVQPSATIGEQFKYTIKVPDVPVLVPLYDVKILDNLGNSSADMSFISATVVAGGNWTLSNGGTVTDLIIEDTITGIDIPPNGQAIIEITVEMLNTSNNNSGDSFGNTASYTYNRKNDDIGTVTPGIAGISPTMTVVEPEPSAITLSKAGLLISAAPVSGGSIIEYTISMTNNGSSTAFDVNVVDNLPPELALAATTPTATIGGNPVIGFVATPAGAPGGPLIWGNGNADGSLDIAVGETLLLTYQAQVQTSTAATFDNTVSTDWTSLNNASAAERTGANCPNITDPNDYCATATSNQFTIDDNNSLSKTIIADSYVDNTIVPPSTADDGIVRIGDTATYRLTLSLSEGTLNNVTVTDVLPAGMAFDSLLSITPPSGADSFIYAAPTPPAAGATGTLVWDFGTVTNTPSGNGTPIDQLVIEYVARVMPDAGITQTPTSTLTNTATLAYVDGAGIPVIDPAQLQDTAVLTLRQPVMDAPVKTESGAPNTVATPLIVDIVNDTMQFQVLSCNTNGLAPAYSLQMSDVLASQLDETSLTAPVVTVNGSVLTAATDYTYTPPGTPGGTMRIELITPVNPGQCITVDYAMGFHVIPANQTWNNSVTVDDYWSLPLDSGQQYAPVGPAQFYMTNPGGDDSLSKIVVAPVSGEITVGELAVYMVAVPIAPTVGVLNNVVVTDTLHASLAFMGVTGNTAADGSGTNVPLGNSGSGQDVILTVGTIPPGEQVFITLTTRLANNAAATAGVSFTNTAVYTSTESPGPFTAISGALTIVEPLVAINKSVSPTTPPNPGDTLVYSLTFTASSGANFSDAFDLSITDTLDPGLAYVLTSSSVDGVGNIIADPVVTGGGSILTWDLSASDIDVVEGTTVTVTYQVSVLAGVVPGQILGNTASTQWTGLDGVVGDPPDPNERDGSDGIGGLNDYVTVPVSTTLTAQSGVLQKLVFPTTKTTVSVGEQFTYHITVPAAFQPTPLNDVRILDNLNITAPDAVDMSFVSVSKVSGSGTWNPENTSGDLKNLVIEDSTGVGIDIPAGEKAVIAITVVLNDTAINTTGLTFDNTASYTYNATQEPGLPDTSDPLIIVGPDTLTLEKSGPLTMLIGPPGDFTLNVQNIGTGPAFDLTITDLLPNPTPGGMCDTPPVITSAQIFVADLSAPVSPVLVEDTHFVTSFSGCTLTITMQSTDAVINPTDRLIVNYQALLDVDTVGGTTLTNIAAATEWFSSDTAGAGATGQTRTYTGTLTDGTVLTLDEQDAWSLNVESPILLFQKSVYNVTASAPGTNAQPGDILRYTLTVENTSVGIPLSGFSLLDELDALNISSAMFVPGSLNVISVPGGAVDNSDPLGGVNGTGYLDIGNLSVTGADGAPGGADTVEVIFEVRLVPVINNGAIVLNQAQIDAFGVVVAISDEPPGIPGDIDTTKTLITSAPAFEVKKSSLDITGDPDVLEPGDRLRYTITVKNIGNENTVETLLTDQIPANTTYVDGSVTLNASVVDLDPADGISPLTAGLLINAPEIALTGFMRADTDVAANNVATITFEVDVNTTVVGGTVISNQGFVTGKGAGSVVFPQQPSDDPTTAAVDDPTIDVVGNLPFFDVQKTVALSDDVNLNGIVDPGDSLRYTITATNFGAVPITNAVFTDPVPADTQYAINSTFLNGEPIADLPGNESPLAAGIDISSSDLTPPLPVAGAGVLVPGQSAVIVFDVVVDATAVPNVTVISNQGIVSSNELPDEPTDADGIDSNGDQPTVVTVGNAPLISITKEVVVIGGGTALAGGQLEYVVRVTNTGLVDVNSVIIIDIVDPATAKMTYIANSATLNGLTAGIGFNGTTFTLTADYSTVYGALPVAGVAELRFRVILDDAPSLNLGDSVSNTAEVSWNVPAITATASVDIGIGGLPGTISLNGQLWHDTNFDNVVDGGEALLQGWRVELLSDNILLANALSDANGGYQFSGLPQSISTVDVPYEIRFITPGATATTATLGQSHSASSNVAPLPVDGPQRVSNIFAASGTSVLNLNFPRQPNGIVYDSVLRLPVPGAQLSMINHTRSNQVVPADCFADPVHANQVTQADGYYKFDLKFGDTDRCLEGDEYEILIQPPANGYVGTTSGIIPPVGTVLDVPVCPNNPALDKITATAQHCENNVSAVQPDPSIASGDAGSEYNLQFVFNVAPLAGTPFTDQIFNNHIPVDPELEAAVAISKVAGKLNVVRSDLVPYTITVTNTLPVPLQDLNVIDNFPAGFKYVAGSARVDGVEAEPLINGLQLTWPDIDIGVAEKRVIKLLLIVGSGVGEGEYVNTAQVINSGTNEPFSGVATATVRVIPDPTFDCTDIIGKVFNDANNNAYQDEGETGIAGVQVATARGLRVTTDSHGRFHITCAIVASEVRGSNFIMKVDDRTLPSGYRVTTENPRVQRATRGKMLKFNFGATIHRVIRLDLSNGVFEKGSTELRPQWRSRIDMLITELQKDASILRLSYMAENETESEVDDRLDAIEDLVSDRWEDLDCCYKLVIETEVFWRKGGPNAGRVFE